MAKLDGIALGAIAAGAGLLYAGVKGKSVPSLIQNFVQGNSPTSASAANTIAGTPASVANAEAAASVAAGAGSAAPQTGSAGHYSQAQLQELWVSNGGASDTAGFAAQVAMAESSGSATVTSPNPDGGINVGVFQLDTKGVGSGHTVAQLQDANLNTQITVMATGNGVNWREWSDPVVNALPGHQYTPGG